MEDEIKKFSVSFQDKLESYFDDLEYEIDDSSPEDIKNSFDEHQAIATELGISIDDRKGRFEEIAETTEVKEHEEHSVSSPTFRSAL